MAGFVGTIAMAGFLWALGNTQYYCQQGVHSVQVSTNEIQKMLSRVGPGDYHHHVRRLPDGTVGRHVAAALFGLAPVSITSFHS